MAFNNLKEKRIREVTGNQLAGVSNVFVDSTSKPDFREIAEIKGSIVNGVTFTGGLPFPDSLVATGFELSNSTQTVKPSDLYPNEIDPESFLCQLNAISVIAASGTSIINITLSNGSADVSLTGLKQVSTSSDKQVYLMPSNVFFTEDTYISVTESATNTAQIDLAATIVSRGGNPQ